MTAKASDLIVPVTTPYVHAAVNVLCPGLGTSIAACVNPEGFNGRLLGLGFLIHFVFFLSFASYPVHMFIACVCVFCEITMLVLCCLGHNCFDMLNCMLCWWLPCVCLPVGWVSFWARPLRLVYTVSLIGMMLWVPELAFFCLHFGARLVNMWHDYQTVKISQARFGN